MADLSTLTEDERVTFWIGALVRNDAWVDIEIDGAWNALAYDLAEPARPQHLGDLLRRARKELLPGADLAPEHRALCLQILNRTSDAHARRSLLAHDHWQQYVPGDEVWHSVKARLSEKNLKSRRPMADFEKCSHDLEDAAVRLRGLGLLLPGWLGRPGTLDDLGQDYRDTWLAITRGDYIIDGYNIRAR